MHHSLSNSDRPVSSSFSLTLTSLHSAAPSSPSTAPSLTDPPLSYLHFPYFLPSPFPSDRLVGTLRAAVAAGRESPDVVAVAARSPAVQALVTETRPVVASLAELLCCKMAALVGQAFAVETAVGTVDLAGKAGKETAVGLS